MALGIEAVITNFLTVWGKILFGFFGVGIAFFIGRTISTSLFICSIILLMLCFMYAVDYIFLTGAIVSFVLGVFTKQGGL
jgi:hypothetical protein